MKRVSVTYMYQFTVKKKVNVTYTKVTGMSVTPTSIYID